MSLKDDFSNLSPTIKSIGLIALGAIVAAAGRFGGGIAVTVVGVGLIALGLVLLAIAQIVQYLDNRRSSRFSRGLQRDVSDKFRQGWQRLAKAGKDKDPYFLPWYIMVGEPGAGKTQAIKHSNIKFVPGFNDPATGEGGTLAMDWWFADKAILLDTAGALLMDTARTEDFQEFLHRIRQHRPLLPINGLILAIPANALQTDTKAEIQSKATTIAQQLDLVQRELGVRFPVYVIITKADLISGFREFFDNINDPTMPTQILGWSNPAGLDGAFDPSEVEKHLESVADALRRRRLALLLDPAGDEESAKRIDKTDALYAFPEQLAQAGMRLRTYLEHVFMPSEWTQAPLFLRGIYFTSSMREGPPLDLDLAQSFNISPRDLPAEVRVWEREKSCFLRDLFVEKIFREKGLVTASKQVEKRVRMRQSMVLGIGVTALLAVLAFTIFGYLQLQDSVGGEYDFWTAATRFNAQHPVAAPALDWAGQSPDTQLSALAIKYKDATTLADLYAANVALAQKEIHTPWIFFFAQALGGELNANHITAHRVLFDRGVARAAWSWLLLQRPWGTAQAWPWDDRADRQFDAAVWNQADQAGGRVLAQLILMDLGGASRAASDAAPAAEMERYHRLLEAAGWPSDPSSARDYRNSWLWFAERGSSQAGADAAKWAKTCVDRMIGYYDNAQQEALKQRAALLSAAQDYDSRETQFIAAAKKAGDPTEIQSLWSGPQLASLIESGNNLTAALKSLSVLPGEAGSGETFASLYDAGGATAGINSIGELIDAIQPSTGAAGLITNLNSALESLKQRLSQVSSAPKADLAKMTDWSASAIDDWQNWPYAKRLWMLSQTRDAWAAVNTPVNTDALADELNNDAKLLTAVNFGAADRDGIAAACGKSMELAARRRAAVAWDAALTADEKVLSAAMSPDARPVTLTLPPFARTDRAPSEAFAAATFGKVLNQLLDRQKLWAAAVIAPDNQTALQQRVEKDQSLINSQFVAGYASAWIGALSMRVSVPPDFKSDVLVGITDQLKELGDTVKGALSAMPGNPLATAPLNSIAAGQAVNADLGDRGSRMLRDWILIYLGNPPEEPHWQNELADLQNQPSNYVSDYWKQVAHCLAVYTNLMDKKPSLDVSLASISDPGLPAAAAGDLDKLKSGFNAISIADGAPAPISSNPRQTIKLSDGLDVRLYGGNNTQIPTDTAGGASNWEVIKLLSDFRSMPSPTDPSLWYVYMESAKGTPLWLKLKFASDAPNF